MSLTLLKSGSLVRYIGSLPGYYNHIGEIVSIDKMNDEETYQLRVRNWKKEEQVIRAYKEDIRPELVTDDILIKIGFAKEGGRNVFVRKERNVVRPIFITYHENGQHYDDKGFVFVEKTLPVPFNEAQMEESVTRVTFLHMVQNYFEAKLGETIDPLLFI